MIMDFDDISRVVKREIVERLDHSSLNDTFENPTAEQIALWIWQTLAVLLPQLSEVALWETSTAAAIVRREHVGA